MYWAIPNAGRVETFLDRGNRCYVMFMQTGGYGHSTSSAALSCVKEN